MFQRLPQLEEQLRILPKVLPLLFRVMVISVGVIFKVVGCYPSGISDVVDHPLGSLLHMWYQLNG